VIRMEILLKLTRIASMRYYVYVIIDPRNQQPIYVGKGTRNRMYKHWSYMMNGTTGRSNMKLYNKLTSIFRHGYTRPIYRKLFKTNDEQLAYAMEVFWIAVIGRKTLCNLTDGGDRLPLMTKDRLRALGIKRDNWLGMKHTPETLLRMSKAQLGRKRTPNQLAAMRQANLTRQKLTADDVRVIRSDNRVQRIVADEYGVTQTLISQIKLGKKHSFVASLN